MFQYALAKHLAIKNNTTVGVDLFMLHDHSSKDPNVVHRFYDLDIFKMQQPTFVSKEESDYYNGIPGKYLHEKIINKIKRIIRPLRLKVEIDKSFNPDFLRIKDNYCIVGSFQSPKYFEEVNNDILHDYEVSENFLAYQVHNNFEKNILSTYNSVSIHIRRGDYVSNKLFNSMLGVLPESYYFNAIKYIRTVVEKPAFFVFSDDIDWCKIVFQKEKDVFFIENEKSKRGAASDLKLISICKHNIISNSSFSWWGAWLNKNPNKIVCAPKRWVSEENIGNKLIHAIDILPDKWIKF
jgi:hypothetical protein